MNHITVRHVSEGTLARFHASGCPLKGHLIEVPQKKWTDRSFETYVVTDIIWDAGSEGRVTVMVDDPSE